MLGRVIRDLLTNSSRTSDAGSSAQMDANSATYTPEVFAVPDLERAKTIILTPEGGLTTDQRWETETIYLAGAIGEALNLDSNSLVLDYGCGIGRMSKALIERYNCKVIGVDISNSMRQLAPGYAATDSFSIVSPEIFRTLVANGLRVDCGITIWVLQHCPGVAEDIALIKSALKKNGKLYVLNNNVSAVPTNKGWVNDGVNVRALLEKTFSVLSYSQLPATATAPMVSENTFIAQFRNDK